MKIKKGDLQQRPNSRMSGIAGPEARNQSFKLHTNDKVQIHGVELCFLGFGSHVEHLNGVWFHSYNSCWPVSNNWNKDGHE